MTNQEAAVLIRNKYLPCVFGNWREAAIMAIHALEAQERNEALYQMQAKRYDDGKTDPYSAGRLDALAEVTQHTVEIFSP